VRKLISGGKLGARGFINAEEVKETIYLVNQSEKNACKQLIAVINKPDSDEALKATEVCRLITAKEGGCLEKLLELGFNGEIELHNEIKKADIDVGDLIGKGKAGMVYMGKYKDSPVAIKMFNNPEKIDDKEFKKEISIMSLVKEPNLILPCYGGSTKKGNKFIITELMEGSLFEFLHDKEVNIDEHLRLIMAISIARCVEFLHSCNLIHRDLKSLNILLNQSFELKICDFGLSRVVDKHAPMTGNVGTVCWIAPEIFNNKKLYTEKADVYSFGIILWELLMRQMPFDDTESFTIPLLVTKGKRPKLPKSTPKDWCKLIDKCWHQKPDKRPTFSQILSMLDTMWTNFHTKNSQYSQLVGFHLNKNKCYKLISLSEEECHERGYAAHLLWGPKTIIALPVAPGKPKKGKQ
jgi:serine/threonine protein kinase